MSEKILFIFSLFLISFYTYGYKGFSGSYLVQIEFIDDNNELMIGETVIIRNHEIDTVITDSTGSCFFVVNWETSGCMKKHLFKRWCCLKGINKPIVLNIRGKEVKLKNKWRKYGLKKVFEPPVTVKEIVKVNW